jgi:hypothetical protein
VRGDGSRSLETDAGPDRTRIRAEALAVAGGRTRLRIAALKEREWTPGGEVSEFRDLDLELALLERLDPAAAARVEGKEPPAAPVASAAALSPASSAPTATAPAPAPGAAGNDAFAPLRDLLGTWAGTLPGGAAIRWRFEFVPEGGFLEVRGSPLLFAGPTARPGAGEEMGRISRAPGGDRLEWHQFTANGSVDLYRSEPAGGDAVAFLAEAPESLPAGARARLTLGRPKDDQVLVVLDVAEPGKDFAVAGAVRLKRVP